MNFTRTSSTYLVFLIEIRPLLRNFFPFLNHSTQGCGEPKILHLKRSLFFDCTRRSPVNPSTWGFLTENEKN